MLWQACGTTHQQRRPVPVLRRRHVNQRLQLRGVPVHGVDGREQVLGEGQGAEPGLDGGGGGQGDELRAGEEDLDVGGRWGM